MPVRNPAVEIKDLLKVYKATNGKKKPGREGDAVRLPALDHIDLEVPQGSLFALLGPNGAGKSTLINIMAGLVLKTTGNVRICGRDIDENPRNARAAIGVVPQEINLDPFFTPREVLEIQAGLYGVPRARRRTDELLRLVGLSDKADSWSRSLSGGMRRRLMVAKALVHAPPVLVLDEPTAGVDIELRRQLWDNVRTLNKQGVTVLLTTHYLEEAEQLCDTIAIINRGKIVACEEKETLLSRIDNKTLHVRLRECPLDIPERVAMYRPDREGRRTLIFRYSPGEQAVGPILDAVRDSGLEIVDLSTDESDLEDVFLQLTRAA